MNIIYLLLACAFGFFLALGLKSVFSWLKKSPTKLSKVLTPTSPSLILKKEKIPTLLKEPYRFGDLTTCSQRVCEILKATQIIAATSSTVLIEGESGTGKERIARLIHNHGCRSTQPFIAVHSAALPETLLESEIFGHEKGAYTGATDLRKGRFELAHKGTILLDEIAELSPHLQVKLLRVLQERSFERLGGNTPIQIDVRVIAATNKNLLQLVQENKFREDLYYRLNVVNLSLLPLRERKEDLALLIEEMISKHILKQGKQIEGYTKSFLAKLQDYSFPGNIRELENIVERAIIFCNNNELDESLIDFSKDSPLRNDRLLTVRPLDHFEKRIDPTKIVEAYYRTHGNKAKAARILGMRESTYRYHLKKAFEFNEKKKGLGA